MASASEASSCCTFSLKGVGSIWKSTVPPFTNSFGFTGMATTWPLTFGVTSTTRAPTTIRPDGVRKFSRATKTPRMNKPTITATVPENQPQRTHLNLEKTSHTRMQ